jgi:hypothetical protein
MLGDLFYTFGLLAISFAAIAALYRHGPQRAYWVGFVIVFTSYFVHAIWPSELRSTWTMMQRAGDIPYATPGMVTTRILSLCYTGLHGDVGLVRGIFRPRSAAIDAATAKFIAFQVIGHTAIALLLGMLGGMLARRLAARPLPPIEALSEEHLQ